MPPEEYDDTLIHYGVLGMKWGVRKRKPSSGSRNVKKKRVASVDRVTKRSNSRENQNGSEREKKSAKITERNIKKVSDADLQKAVDRLILEKRYVDLDKALHSKGTTAGRKLVGEILYGSAKNIGTQAVSYLLGKGVNYMARNRFGEDIVNPKKGQSSNQAKKKKNDDD